MIKNLVAKFIQYKYSKYILYSIYIIALISTYNYVRNVLEEGDVKVEEKKQKEVGIFEKPVKVRLTIELPNKKLEFVENAKNTQTVYDLIENYRKNNIITYERTAYTYGIEIDSINNIIPEENKKWVVLMKLPEDEENLLNHKDNLKISDEDFEIYKKASKEFTDITYYIEDIKLMDKAEFIVKII